MKKRILPILLLISPYIFITIILFNVMKVTTIFPLISRIIVFAVFIPNLIFAFVIPKHGGDSNFLLFWDMILKLCNIPIYVIVFILGVFMALFPKGIVIAPFLMIFDYILLLPSSMYGVSGLIQACREGKITAVTAIVTGVLHFFFCTDVIAAIVMYCMVKQKSKSQVNTF